MAAKEDLCRDSGNDYYYGPGAGSPPKQISSKPSPPNNISSKQAHKNPRSEEEFGLKEMKKNIEQ